MLRENILVFGDAVSVIITVIVIVISIVASLIQQLLEATKHNRRPADARKRPAAPAAIDLQAEIDALTKGQPRIEEPRGRRVPQPSSPAAVEAIIVAEPVEQPLAEPAQQSLAEHVRQTMGDSLRRPIPAATQPSIERGRRGARDRREHRRGGPGARQPASRQVAETKVAPPERASSAPPAPTAAVAAHVVRAREYPLSAALLQSLQSPQGLATAFVLREILERPEARWQK